MCTLYDVSLVKAILRESIPLAVGNPSPLMILNLFNLALSSSDVLGSTSPTSRFLFSPLTRERRLLSARSSSSAARLRN